MSILLAGANVIVAARQFNPSVFNPVWFARSGLFIESDFGAGHVIGDGLVQISNPLFQMLVLPSQLQFAPDEKVANQQQLIEEKVGGIVQTLPHTPYVAIGLNFVWHMRDERVEVERLSRELFFKADSELYRRFDTEDARFGAYLSRDLRGCRQKLDIKPISLDESTNLNMQVIQFAFNYHRELTDAEEPVRQIHEMLERWNEFREESRQLVESLQRRA